MFQNLGKSKARLLQFHNKRAFCKLRFRYMFFIIYLDARSEVSLRVGHTLPQDRSIE